MPSTQLTKVLKFHHQKTLTHTLHKLDNPQLYFHSLYVYKSTSFNTAASRLRSSHSTPTMQNRYWSRGECHTCRRIQMPMPTVQLQPRRCTAWTNSFKYNDYCLWWSHHTTLWHLWAHLVTPWPLQIVCVPCSEHCRPNNSGSPNLSWYEACHPQPWYLYYTDWNSANARSTRQCRCKVRASLPVSGLLPGNWMLSERVSHHPGSHCSTGHPPTMTCTWSTTCPS